MLIAIALQESEFKYRRQLVGPGKWWTSKGPAASFWQIELPHIGLLLSHAKVGTMLRNVLDKLGYPPIAAVIHEAIEHNDILAVCIARLTLLTFPGPLPLSTQVEEGWNQYIWCWRPGKPHRERWMQCFTDAWLIEFDAGGDNAL